MKSKLKENLFVDEALTPQFIFSSYSSEKCYNREVNLSQTSLFPPLKPKG
jgi:hypothetical protein